LTFGPLGCALPSRNPIPSENRKKYEDKRIAFVSISIDQKSDYENGKPCHNEKRASCLQTTIGIQFMIKYGVTSIPRFILLGPDGNIVNSNATTFRSCTTG
jgi:hypothetical protein